MVQMGIMVTGGSGLVGSTINADIKLSSKDADLRNWNETISIFEKYKPDEVIHCAGKVGGVGSNMNYKGEFFYDNIMINTNVLEACRITGVKKVVSFLSTCIFPDDIEYPLTEKKIHIGEPHNSNYAYAYAKRMLDIQSRAYKEQYGVNYTCVIPTNIYGPNDNFNLENGHVLPALIHKCYLAKKNNTDFVVWGSGKPLREFIYSEDVGRLTEWALNNYEEEEPIIFSTSDEISIGNVAEMVVYYMGFKGKLILDDEKPDGQFRKPSDNSKLKSYLPDFEFTPIDKGIEKSVNWFVENYEEARK
jgi:GDP-L-fucose synthase|tara:strand:- start:415 stop:1326 length:912 start_codon:yes stop_codon:yes gene_type:complete